MTLHPALQSMRIPKRDAVVISGIMCPVRIVGKPGMRMSHICDDTICPPSGSIADIGDEVRRFLRHGAPLVRRIEVAPVSAMAWVGSTIIPRARWCAASESAGIVFDVTTVTLSLLSSSEEVVAENKYLVGYGDLR